MITFRKYITESVRNLIGADEDKKKYADSVWDILQKSYAPIGGIKGSGFESKLSMIQSIPFWKLYFKNSRLVAVAMYKDNQGRKGVAYGTDGTAVGKTALADIFKNDFGRSYEELSGSAFSFVMKNVPKYALMPYFISPSKIAKILSGDKIILPTQEYVNDNLSKSDQGMWNRYQELHDFFYVREIGGKPHLKIAIGTEGKSIV